jgi:hypothetical protein
MDHQTDALQYLYAKMFDARWQEAMRFLFGVTPEPFDAAEYTRKLKETYATEQYSKKVLDVLGDD